MAGGHPARSLAIDTSLFLLVVTYRCLASGNARDRVRILTDIRGRSDNLPPERFDDAAEQQKATLITDDAKLLHYAYIRSVPAFPLHRVHNSITHSW